MRFVLSLFMFAAGAWAQQQTAADDASAKATRGMPARATPNDYQAHTKVGDYSIGAEFFQHTVPTPNGILVNDDYIVVEAGIFGPAGSHTKLNPEDFSLRINAKKNPQASEAYPLVYKGLKDPEWEAPEAIAAKKNGGDSKTSLGGGSAGGQGAAGDPKPVYHPPFKLQREWNQRLEKQAFPEGDRPLPQAGLLFFLYRGKASGIHQLELIYNGPAGKVSLELQP